MMTPKRTVLGSALIALLVTGAALLSVAAAQSDDASLEALREEIANLETRLAELEASNTLSTLLLANNYLVGAQFHAMDDALNSGEMDPRYLTTVRETSAIVEAISWPEGLQDSVNAFLASSDELASALEAEDIEAAGDAAADVHGSQHDLSNAIFNMATGQAVGGHGHGEADNGGGAGSDDQTANDGVDEENGTQEQEVEVPEGAVELTLELNQQGGAAGGAATHAVRSGDVIALTIRTEAAGELHLHGYELEWHLEAGEQRTDIVETSSVGRFPLEFHPEDDPRGIVVGYVEVRP